MTAAQAIDPRRAAKRVRDRNYRFRKLSPEMQRVRIARDVIAQLRDGSINALPGNYLSFPNPVAWDSAQRSNGQVHIALDDQHGCHVCALGATFVCAVKRANGLPFSQFSAHRFEVNKTRLSIHSYLQHWFSLEQLGLIECSFERDARWAMPETPLDLIDRALKFSNLRSWVTYSSGSELMVAIMKNIISNRGEFVP